MDRFTVRITLLLMLAGVAIWAVLLLTHSGVLIAQRISTKSDGVGDALDCAYFGANDMHSRRYRYDETGGSGRTTCPIIINLCDAAFDSEALAEGNPKTAKSSTCEQILR
jgi:hypothetical protein